jgi:hypothetical protein
MLYERKTAQSYSLELVSFRSKRTTISNKSALLFDWLLSDVFGPIDPTGTSLRIHLVFQCFKFDSHNTWSCSVLFWFFLILIFWDFFVSFGDRCDFDLSDWIVTYSPARDYCAICNSFNGHFIDDLCFLLVVFVPFALFGSKSLVMLPLGESRLNIIENYLSASLSSCSLIIESA